MTWRLPDTYHSAGTRQGTATLKFYEGRDILRERVNDHFVSSDLYILLAAIAGGVITAAATLWGVQMTAQRSAKAQQAERRLRAYADLLVAAGTVLSTYRQLQDALSPDFAKSAADDANARMASLALTLHQASAIVALTGTELGRKQGHDLYQAAREVAASRMEPTGDPNYPWHMSSKDDKERHPDSSPFGVQRYELVVLGLVRLFFVLLLQEFLPDAFPAGCGVAVRGPRRRARHRADYRTSPVHPRDRGLGVIAELLRDPLGAPPAAVDPDGRGDGLPDLARVRLIGALQHRHEQGVGPDRGGAGVPRCYLHVHELGHAAHRRSARGTGNQGNL